MTQQVKQPSKEQVHKWLVDQVKRHVPPPTPEEIRRQLGWNLVQKSTH